MENLVERMNKLGGPPIRINKNIKKSENDKYVAKKLAKANKILAESPPPIFYTHKPMLYSDTALANEATLAHASEPPVEYGEPKKEEEA